MSAAPDAALRRLVGYRMHRATSALGGPVNAVLARFGLRRTTFSALSIVAGTPGLTQARLAEALAMERPNVVQVVGRLEDAGLVVRARDAEDRRAYALRATEAGRRRLAGAEAAILRLDAALIRGLSEAELAALERALAVVERNAQEVMTDADLPPP